jgi:hypothetical protein
MPNTCACGIELSCLLKNKKTRKNNRKIINIGAWPYMLINIEKTESEIESTEAKVPNY